MSYNDEKQWTYAIKQCEMVAWNFKTKQNKANWYTMDDFLKQNVKYLTH